MDNLQQYFSEQGLNRFSENEAILQRIKYATFVGEKYPFLFVETPKCACSTMKKIVAHIEGKEIPRVHVWKETTLDMSLHSRAVHPVKNLNLFAPKQIKHILTSPNVTRFCVVRNPYARLLSAWADKIRQKEPAYQKYWEIIATFNGKRPDVCPDFEDFVNWVTSVHEEEVVDPHWKPMKKILLPELIHYSHTVKTENIVDDFQKVLDSIHFKTPSKVLLSDFRINESLPIHWKSMYNAELAKKVYQYYEDDFVYFNYSENSWREDLEGSKPITNSDVVEAALSAIRNRNELIDHLIAENRGLKKPSFCRRIQNKIKRFLNKFKN